MKHNRWTRISCLLLALCLIAALFPISVTAAEDEQERDVVDFVLLVDCSGTMAENDKEGLAVEAVRLFMEMVPLVDARIAVVAFGYRGNNCSVTHFEVNVDKDLVHVLSTLEGNLDKERKDEIEAAVGKAVPMGTKDSQSKTPIGAALAVGVDMLLESGSVDGNACLILMSDGIHSSNYYPEDNELCTEATAVAKQHKWPIYCIELDYYNKNVAGSEGRERLDTIVVDSGAGLEGCKKVRSSADIAEAFMAIKSLFWDEGEDPEPIKLDDNGVVEKVFTIDPLTSEANISISSGKVTKIELVNEKQNISESYVRDTETERRVVTIRNSFTSVKMVCPAAGEWKVRVYGDPNATITWYAGSQNEMNLVMNAVSDTSASVLTKNDTITVNARYTYNNIDVLNDDAYLSTPAQLIVMNKRTGESKTYEMGATKDGYSYSLDVGDAPGSGDISVMVKVTNSMFRSGSVASNSQDFSIMDELATLVNPGVPVERTAYLNSTFDSIDLLKEVVSNPDGDTLSYDLSCVSDRNVTFQWEINENGYLTIQTGVEPGVYELELVISEAGMQQSQYLVQPITLTVENRPVEVTEISDQELWVDYINFLFIKQDPSNLEIHLDLSQYFSDPDGMGVTFGNVDTSESGIVEAELEGATLSLIPEEKGEVTVSFTVTDGVEEEEIEFKVKVISGVALYWKQYGLIWGIVVAAIVVTIIVVLSILKNKGVKGIWDITLSENMEELPPAQDVEISSHISSMSKHKVYLHEIVGSVANMVTDEDLVNKYFVGNGAEQIVFDGIYFGKGCVVTGLPKQESEQLRVMVNNSIIVKNTKFGKGNIIVEIDNGTDKLEIKMELR